MTLLVLRFITWLLGPERIKRAYYKRLLRQERADLIAAPGTNGNDMQHAMNIGGFGKGGTIALVPGRKVVAVQWDGCMAHVRKEVDEGTLESGNWVPQERGQPISGVYVNWKKRGRRFEPDSRIRVVLLKSPKLGGWPDAQMECWQ